MKTIIFILFTVGLISQTALPQSHHDFSQQRNFIHRPATHFLKTNSYSGWYENPHSIRGFMAQTGYGLKEGEFYYQNVWLLYNSLSYGFTDQFNLGVGFFPIIYPGDLYYIHVSPKFIYEIEDDLWSFSASGFYTDIIKDEDGTFIGAHLGLTYGSRDKNLNLGIAYGSFLRNFLDGPIFIFGGMITLDGTVCLVSETWFYPRESSEWALHPGGYEPASSLLVSFLFNHFSLDLGYIMSPIEVFYQLQGFPIIGFRIPFGYRDYP